MISNPKLQSVLIRIFFLRTSYPYFRFSHSNNLLIHRESCFIKTVDFGYCWWKTYLKNWVTTFLCIVLLLEHCRDYSACEFGHFLKCHNSKSHQIFFLNEKTRKKSQMLQKSFFISVENEISQLILSFRNNQLSACTNTW